MNKYLSPRYCQKLAMALHLGHFLGYQSSE